jgi:hypothetical protein
MTLAKGVEQRPRFPDASGNRVKPETLKDFYASRACAARGTRLCFADASADARRSDLMTMLVDTNVSTTSEWFALPASYLLGGAKNL